MPKAKITIEFEVDISDEFATEVIMSSGATSDTASDAPPTGTGKASRRGAKRDAAPPPVDKKAKKAAAKAAVDAANKIKIVEIGKLFTGVVKLDPERAKQCRDLLKKHDSENLTGLKPAVYDAVLEDIRALHAEISSDKKEDSDDDMFS